MITNASPGALKPGIEPQGKRGKRKVRSSAFKVRQDALEKTAVGTIDRLIKDVFFLAGGPARVELSDHFILSTYVEVKYRLSRYPQHGGYSRELSNDEAIAAVKASERGGPVLEDFARDLLKEITR